MKAHHAHVYRMLVRVRTFGETQKQRFPETSVAGQLFDRIAAAATEVERFAATRSNALSQTAKAKREAKAALWEALGAMSQTARSLEPTTPGFVNKFQLPKRRNAEAVLSAGRAFLEAARPHNALLAAHALDLAAFEAAIERYEAAVRDRDAGKEVNAVARTRIEQAVNAGLIAARQLDAIVRNALRSDAGMVAMWEQDRYIPYPQSRKRPTAPADSVALKAA